MLVKVEMEVRSERRITFLAQKCHQWAEAAAAPGVGGDSCPSCSAVGQSGIMPEA